MGRFRVGAFLGVVGSGALIALGAANCAAPTQIIVEVRADKSLCDGPNAIRGTGIAVTTADKIDQDPLEIFEGPGCDAPGDLIGELTITPSGADDAEVAIRIVAGVTMAANLCEGPNWEGCILARRKERFLANQTVRITVILSEECIGRGCGKDECARGACVPPDQIPNDGGPVERPDSGSKDVNVPSEDAPSDGPIPIVDSGLDACVNCNKTGMTCNGVTHACDIDCTKANCLDQVLCGEQLDCVFQCPNQTCSNVRCASPKGNCTFNCLGGVAATHCSNISCSSNVCNVKCQDPNACNGVFLDAGTNEVQCISTDKVSCDNVHCTSGQGANACRRSCGDAGIACGATTSCKPAAGCGGWEDGGDGG